MAKKSLNNPNKPAVKTRSTISPGGKSVKVAQVRGDKTAMYAGNAKKPIANAKGNTVEAYSVGKNLRDTKKVIRKGDFGGGNTDLSKTTKKPRGNR
jgi:hypothetical protein